MNPVPTNPMPIFAVGNKPEDRSGVNDETRSLLNRAEAHDLAPERVLHAIELAFADRDMWKARYDALDHELQETKRELQIVKQHVSESQISEQDSVMFNQEERREGQSFGLMDRMLIVEQRLQALSNDFMQSSSRVIATENRLITAIRNHDALVSRVEKLERTQPIIFGGVPKGDNT